MDPSITASPTRRPRHRSGEPVSLAVGCCRHADNGLIEADGPVKPLNAASPKLNMPPSDATSQYPPPSGVGAMPTMGELRWMAPVEP